MVEHSAWHEVRQLAGIRMSPRHLWSIGDGEGRALRYSTASWRMILPCLSMQWNVPRKNRPSLTPISIRRKRSFLNCATADDSSSPLDLSDTLLETSCKNEGLENDSASSISRVKCSDDGRSTFQFQVDNWQTK